MTNTYSSKKTRMKRGKGTKHRNCNCSYCRSPYFGRNHKRGNKFQWIMKFDALSGDSWMMNFQNHKQKMVDCS